jgi:hypothetical protein
MTIKKSIQSQYHAALMMLKSAIEKCPEKLWAEDDYVNPFWHVAYHVLFYTHFYLSPNSKDFIPWEQHRDEITSLEPSVKEIQPYHKEAILNYLDLCLEQVEAQVSAMDLDAESGFNWLPFNKLELQFYNIRHIQQHTGELCERLGAHGEIEVGWVGMKR